MFQSESERLRQLRPGTVVRVTPERIVVRNADGTAGEHELYNNFPFNYKTFIHNEPVVNPATPSVPDQLLAKSNYTDPQGNLALGLNMRVGYLPYQTRQGNNYEDAIVIGEGAAKRLTSEHMKQVVWEPGEGKEQGRDAFVSIYPGTFTREQLAGIGTDGVIKPGTVPSSSDPLVLAVQRKQPQRGSMLHKSRKSYTSDASETWQGKHEGVVTDVHTDEDGVKVTVKHYQPMGVGDKLSNRYGGKGVIGAVIPDDQMPKSTDGKPLEILLNPLGIISRTNPKQAVETALGKIARKTGKHYNIRAFERDRDLTQFATDELNKHGLSDTETLYDPATNRHLRDILTGEQFFYKLHHTAETKETGRGEIGSYTAEEQPAKGGSEGAKASWLARHQRPHQPRGDRRHPRREADPRTEER
jgi:DNA-directed RNA polymerase subunit beta